MSKPSSSREFQPDALTGRVRNLDVTFHWITGSDRFWFKRETQTGNEFIVVDAQTGEQSLADDTIALHPEPPRADWVVSSTGQSAVLRRQNDLWLRDLLSGEERRLTHDGEPHFGYGDVDPSHDRQGVARRRANRPNPLRGVIWSPDSRFVVALRQDLRSCPERLFVTEYTPPDGTYTQPHFRRIRLGGDAATPDSQLIVYDTKSSTLLALALNPQALNDLALHYFLEGVVWWGADGRSLFLISANRGGSRYALNAADLATGQTRELLRETAPFYVRLNPFDYARPNVYIASDGAEIIWYSERSGYGHLYLYDAATGQLKRQITLGDWVVFDLLRVDEAQRLLYFTAATRSVTGNPYYRFLYRVSLDGGEPELLTPETADHEFRNTFFPGAYRFPNDGTGMPQPGASMSPSGRYFIDSYSTTEQPPQYVLRRASGELVAKVLVSDASDLYASGWRPPERVVIKAADGVTDLYGVITRPRDFDPTRKYPVIDSMYPGPQGSFAPRTFLDQLAGGSIHHLQTFADAGFIVVTIDGRGTAHRSRAFRDAFLGTEDAFGAADHVAAITQLAAHRPYMDLERVGVRGQSFGGYGALRALLLFPDFFKVAISATGPNGYLDVAGQIHVERFFGVAAASVQSREYYEIVSNTRLVSRLKGSVLLIYGGIDENVPLKSGFVMVDAFIKADKDVDMLIVPDCAHAVSADPYVIRRSVQYFIEHLAGR
jgi:dipeptidyl aminopeptidase/acylaminoacyl peptidase